MRANQAQFRIATMARVLGVSPSGFDAWRQRGSSARERSDEALTARVRAIHAHSRGSYGAPRIQAELAEQGTPVSRKRVARVMRQAGLAGVSRRKGPRTTRRDAQARPARCRTWWSVSSTPTPRTGCGWLTSPTCRPWRDSCTWPSSSTCSAAGSWAGRWPGTCAPNPCSTHSTWPSNNADRTPSSTIPTRAANTPPSPSASAAGDSVGDCFDNAMAESFFATLECELLDRTHFHDHHQARRAIFEFIEGWYNPHRRHRGLGQQSPIAFERSYQDAA